MQTTYKVGDKVRILGTENIFLGEEIKIVGGYAEVESVSNEGYPRLACRDGAPLIITKSELQYIEKVAEQVAKFKVGDKVRMTLVKGALSGFEIGDEVVIFASKFDGSKKGGSADYSVRKGSSATGYCNADQFELISQKPTKNQRLTSAEQAISTLEQKVEAMQAEIDALKAAQKPPVTVIADAVKRYKERTPNQKRKEIIDEAKAFLEEVEREQNDNKVRDKGNAFHRQYLTKTEFIVNAEKRTVVAIIRTKYGTTLLTKGIAKCNPSDVFNEHIGKAIALGRALGLDVSKFEKAVQPSEVVVGQVVKGGEKCLWSGEYGEVIYAGDGPYAYAENGYAFYNQRGEHRWSYLKNAVILEDTEAQY